MRNRQYDFRTETRGDEERGLLENPKNPGFSCRKSKRALRGHRIGQKQKIAKIVFDQAFERKLERDQANAPSLRL